MLTRTRQRVMFLAAMTVAVVLVAFPFYWLTISSLKTSRQLFGVQLFPNPITLVNYVTVFTTTRVPTYLLNSVIVAVVVTVLTLFAAVLGAYSLVFFRYAGREVLGRLILFTYMFPGVVIIVPTHRIMTYLHMTNNLAGVIIVELVLTVPFAVWMLRGFFLDIPKELEEAAIIDGCSKMGALYHVLLPVGTPGIIAAAVFAFVFSWNEYLFPLVLINNEGAKTLPLGVAGFMGHLYVQWGPLLASGVVSTVPILLLFIFLQRYLIEGIMAGAVKG
jgi:multiple sugar transport system permease protein